LRTTIAKKLGTNTIMPTNNKGRVLDHKDLNLGYTMMKYKASPHHTSPAEIIQKDGNFIKTNRRIKPANASPYEIDPANESPARLPHSQTQTPNTIEMKI
jgi:hypothetical protein